MDWKMLVIDIFLYIFEAWVFNFYAKLISLSYKKFWIRVLGIAAGYAVLLVFYEMHRLPLIALSIILINSLLLFSLFSINFQTALFHSCILLGVMVSSEAITMPFVALLTEQSLNFQPQADVYVINVVISKLVYFIIALIIAFLFAKKERNQKNFKPYWIMLILPISGIIILTIFAKVIIQYTLSTELYFFAIGIAFLVLLSTVIVFYAFEVAQKESAELSDLRAIQQKQEIDQKYFEIVDQSNKEMQILAHDTKNHLMQICNMENMESVQKYIDSIYPSLDKFSSIGISQNKILDLIISKYIKLCEKNHLQFSVNVKTANLHYIEDADLSTILNNLLDNSMEAAEQSQEKRISFSLYSRSKRYDALVLENSCDIPPIVEGSKLKTTKPEKRLHGLGLKSVLKVVEKYSGMYDWEYNEEQKLFKTVIAFPKSVI